MNPHWSLLFCSGVLLLLFISCTLILRLVLCTPTPIHLLYMMYPARCCLRISKQFFFHMDTYATTPHFFSLSVRRSSTWHLICYIPLYYILSPLLSVRRSSTRHLICYIPLYYTLSPPHRQRSKDHLYYQHPSNTPPYPNLLAFPHVLPPPQP